MSTFGEGVEVYGKLAKVIQRFRCDRPDEWTMDEFIREAQELQKENDELRALLDDYKDFTGLVDFDEKVVTETISKIKADAIREMLDEVWRSDTERVDIEDYATNLEQDNERD